MILVGRFSPVVLGAVTLAAACCAVVAGAALPAGASTQAVVSAWATEQQVPGLAALSTGHTSGINSLSCGSAGNCAAGGEYADSADDEEAFVADESGRSWGMAQAVPGVAALSTGVWSGDLVGIKSAINSLSCASAGNCAAGGEYADSADDEQAFVVDEVKGSWGTAEEVPGLAALNHGGGAEGSGASVTSVSCASAGNCAAVGTYTPSSGGEQAFVVDETGGTWGTAQEVPGLAALDTGGLATITSVSCASAGNCAAGGSYAVGSVADRQAFLVDETGGTWGTAHEVPGTAALNTYEWASTDSVSCPSAGNCTATGQVSTLYAAYTHAEVPQAFVVDETAGSWGTAKLLKGTTPPLPGGSYQTGSIFNSVSCGSAGNCVAAGDIYPGPPIIAEESGGSWGAAKAIPGMAAASALSVSCPSAGNCAVGGLSNSSSTSFVLDETDGSWGTAQEVPGSAGNTWTVTSVSCGSAGSCTAGGTYYDATTLATLAFVVDEKPATTSVLGLSGAKVTYGKEQTERVSVTVKAPSGGTPSGTVTVNAGTTVVCGNISVSDGRAACTVAATKLPAGTWHLTATYNGNASLAPSTSEARTLTVAKATSKVTLSLSAARVTYGQERSERLTVKVTGQYAGTPTGKVTVTSGTTTVCTITLASGKGSCVLSAKKLPVGTRTLTAVYGGSGDFTGAASARKTLKVVK
jgi:hypothetical protein